MNNFISIFTDGGARGNPGEAAVGVYIVDSDNIEIAGFGKRIGIATNNTAEYRAVLEGLDFIIKNKERLKAIGVIYFFLDSLLVCSQINKLYKVKNLNLRNLLLAVWDKEKEIKIPIFYKHIPREKNKKADMYVNKALNAE